MNIVLIAILIYVFLQLVLGFVISRRIHTEDDYHLAGALVSAILSTVDSALLAASLLVSRNIIWSLYPNMTDKQRLYTSRIGVLVMGCLAYVLALHAEGVYHLVLDASAFGSAGFFVVAVFGLFTKFGGANSAIAALVSGAAVWVTGNYVFDFELSYIASLAAAFGMYVVTALAERKNTVK